MNKPLVGAASSGSGIIGVVVVGHLGMFVIYTPRFEDWPLCLTCSTSFWLVPGTETENSE